MENGKVKVNPDFLEYVFKLTKNFTLYQALDNGLDHIDAIDVNQFNRIGLKTYKEGKWTINKILQHLMDWERIWCFRAILFARGEGTIPVAHDQEIMGKNSNANELPIEQLIQEFKIVRQSTILLFKSFDEDILNINCVFFEYEMQLRAIGLTIAAHQMHHFRVIQERYLPLDK